MTSLYFSCSGPFWLFDPMLVPALKRIYVDWSRNLGDFVAGEDVSLGFKSFRGCKWSYPVLFCSCHLLKKLWPSIFSNVWIPGNPHPIFWFMYALLIEIGVDLLGWGRSLLKGRLILWFKYKYAFETLRAEGEKTL